MSTMEWSEELLFVGDDWAEEHHDVELQDETGRVLGRAKLPEGVAGIARLHAMIGEHLGEDDDAKVVVGIETDRGPWVQALIAAGYQIYAINPLQVARYRERRSVSGAKSDPADAHVICDMVRTDRHQLRPVAGDRVEAEAVKVVTRAHKTLIWERTRHMLRLRHALREFFPAALAAFDDLTAKDALELLGAAPDPASVLPGAEDADECVAVGADVGGMRKPRMEEQVEAHFGEHPDAEVYLSQPGLGVLLGARVLAEFGDDKQRYADARARKNYAGTSPITRQSGKRKLVLARYVHNDRLVDALGLQAFSALRSSPGARAYYDQLRARGTGHRAALRQLGNRLVGILHGCLKTSTNYHEDKAWAPAKQDQQIAA